MRRAIIIPAGLLAALIVPTLRVANGKPLFAPTSAYHALEGSISSAPEILLIRLALLAAVLAAYAAATKKHGLPQESTLLLLATPALLLAALLPTATLWIALLATLATLTWERTTLLTTIAATAAVMTSSSWPLALLLAAVFAVRRRYLALIITAAASTLGYVLNGAPALQAFGLAELGSIGANSVFIVLLALSGVLLLWSENSYGALLLSLTMITLSLYLPALSLLAALLGAALAGAAFQALRTRDWRLTSVQNLSIFLALLGILFTVAASVTEAQRAPPGEDLLETIGILHSIDSEEILVAPQHQDILAWYGLDSQSQGWRTVAESRNWERTRQHLPRYILVHEDDDAPGLRFLLTHTEHFRLVADGTWKVYRVRA